MFVFRLFSIFFFSFLISSFSLSFLLSFFQSFLFSAFFLFFFFHSFFSLFSVSFLQFPSFSSPPPRSFVFFLQDFIETNYFETRHTVKVAVTSSGFGEKTSMKRFCPGRNSQFSVELTFSYVYFLANHMFTKNSSLGCFVWRFHKNFEIEFRTNELWVDHEHCGNKSLLRCVLGCVDWF